MTHYQRGDYQCANRLKLPTFKATIPEWLRILALVEQLASWP